MRYNSLQRLQERYREQSYQAITVFDQCRALVRGLSKKIMKVSQGVKELRARVVVRDIQFISATKLNSLNQSTSEQTKRRREEEIRSRAESTSTVSTVDPATSITPELPSNISQEAPGREWIHFEY